MNLAIKDRVALITGGSQGIGLEIAKSLAEEGVKIALFAKDKEMMAEAKKQLQEMTPHVFTVEGDALLPDTIESAVSAIKAHYGKIDILVNNIGFTGRFVKFEELEISEWKNLFELNVMSGVRFTQSVISEMKKNRWGRVIFIASESAMQPDAEMAHYNASKAALLALSKSLANGLGEYDITVNAVSPGPTITPLWEKLAAQQNLSLDEFVKNFHESGARKLPLKRFGKPTDTAAVVAFLCSEKAAWITGANYRVDGGSVKHI